jgi:uncharacterized surface protein with fasciclin (FAS1) repeats
MINASRLTAFAAATTMGLAFSSVASANGPKGVVPGKPGDANIVEIAAAVNALTETATEPGEFAYLLAAAQCPQLGGGVVALLTGTDKYTLFAPTNAAFIALQTTLLEAAGLDIEPAPAVTCAVDDLLGEGTLFAVLAYHVTEGRRFSNSVFNRNSSKFVEMLAGGYVVANPNLTLSDNAGQTVGIVPKIGAIDTVNVNASNGVIHVIDTVLLPIVP